RVLPAGDRAKDVLVDQRGLADQPRAEHQDRPAVARTEQPGQLGDLAVAPDRPVEVVGIEPVQAAPDALQLALAFEDRLSPQRRPPARQVRRAGPAAPARAGAGAGRARAGSGPAPGWDRAAPVRGGTAGGPRTPAPARRPRRPSARRSAA